MYYICQLYFDRLKTLNIQDKKGLAMKLRMLLLSTFVILGISNIDAKRYNPYGTDWAMGFYIGGTSFFGDLRAESGGLNSTPFSKYFYQDMRAMGGINLEKWFGPYVGIIGNVQYGYIQGTKETSSAYFEAWLFEYNLNVTANITNIILDIDRRRHWMAYTSVGIGMSESRTWKYSTVTGKQIGSNGFGTPKTEGDPFIPMTEPIGNMALGFKFYVGGNLSINIEGSMHIINSDKLDATPNDNSSFFASIEGYNFYSIGLQYHFGFNGYHITNRYKHRARYNGGRSGYVKINSRKTGRKNHKIFKKGKRRFKFTRR